MPKLAVLKGSVRTVSGFYSVEVPVRLGQPTLNVRAQLNVGQECGPAPASIIGTVLSADPTGTLWVKVMPAYGSVGMEAKVSRHGFFVAAGLDDGQYLLVLLKGSVPIYSEVVSVARETKVTIDLTNTTQPSRSAAHE